MKITLVSAYLNHHQRMFCDALRKCCDEFCYISTSRICKKRLSLGYKELDFECDYVIRAYDKNVDEKQIFDILDESDAVIFGSCPNSYIEHRMKQNRLSFLFSERFFKKGVWRRFNPSTKEKVVSRIVKFRDKNIYVLCASAFLSWELSLLGFPLGKCFKWGYFPQVDSYEHYPERKNEKIKILWAGRMIDWKRADTALKACASLQRAGVDFILDFIGEGECMEGLKTLSEKYNMSDKVRFLGSVPSEKVREAMLDSDIFLFTSNFREGWGAVLNEAMSCGCAVLAGSGIGAVPFLVKDNINAVIYKSNSQKDFNRKLKALATDKEKRRALGVNAIHTINNEYSAEIAAQRLVEFIECEDKKTYGYESGPMSLAEKIKNNWYK